MCISIIWGKMDMNEWNRILSDRRRRIAILCIPILCLFLFFYQKCDGNFRALVTDAEDYRELLETYGSSAPAEIAEAFPERWALEKNEMRLLTQVEHLRDYSRYLSRVQEQAKNMQASSLFNGNRNSFVYRNILKTAEDFAGCSADGVSLGNDRAMQDWLEFSWADWGFLAVILLLVMSFLEERQKGLSAIIRSCPAGRGKLQCSRLLILLFYSAGMTLFLYYLPLVLSLCLDGSWGDLSRPVQSLAEFQKCTTQLSIFQFFLQFFLVKTACGFLLGVLIWFLLSFLEHVQLCWMLTAAGLAVEYLLYTLIPAQSIFSPLRHVNVFSYVFTTRLYTEYVNINFFSFPVGRRTLLLILLAVVIILLSVITMWVLTKRFPFGNRDWLGKWIHLWNRVGDAVRRHLGLFGFELYKLMFLSAGGILLVLGFMLTQNIESNSGSYYRVEDGLYRQYVAEVQGPVTQSTYDYMVEARQMLQYSDMYTSEFEAALDRLEQTLSELDGNAWIVDEVPFLNVYGEKSWRMPRKNGLIAMIFLVVCLSSLYTCEQSGDVQRILRSTPGGRERLFWAKYAVSLSIMLLVWLRVFVGEWRSALDYMGSMIPSAPCSSISMVKAYPMTVGTFLILLYLSKAVGLLVPMHLCIFICERCRGFEKAFLISSIVLLIPAVAYQFGVDALTVLTPVSFVSDKSPLLAGPSSIPQFAVWMFLSVLALLDARRRWCRCSSQPSAGRTI